MLKWSFGNHICSVNYKQFRNYMARFKDVIEQSLNTECQLEITGHGAIKEYITIVDPEWPEFLDKKNEKNKLFVEKDMAAITSEMWKKAKHITVKLDTELEGQNSRSPYGWIEFKGMFLGCATFSFENYDDPSSEQVIKNEMLSLYPRKLVNDGYNSHGINRIGDGVPFGGCCSDLGF